MISLENSVSLRMEQYMEIVATKLDMNHIFIDIMTILGTESYTILVVEQI